MTYYQVNCWSPIILKMQERKETRPEATACLKLQLPFQSMEIMAMLSKSVKITSMEYGNIKYLTNDKHFSQFENAKHLIIRK